MSGLKERRNRLGSSRVGMLAERFGHGRLLDRERLMLGELLAGDGQAPSPWAIAVAVLALLGFGVLVGNTVSPAQSSPSALVLPSASSAHSAGTQTGASTPPPVKPEAAPSASSSEGSNGESSEEAGKEAGGESAGKPGASGGKTKGSKESGGAGGSGSAAPTAGSGSEGAPGSLPPIAHMFLIVLSEEGYGATFGAGASAPYLAKTLPGEGELLQSYYAVAAGEPANGIALISGQGPTPQTQAGCALYTDVAPGSAGPEGQTLGNGCVYPSATSTIANQLEAAGKTWRAYIEGIENGGQAVGSSASASAGSPAIPSAGSPTTSAGSPTTPAGSSVALLANSSAAGGCPHPQQGASDPNHAPSAANGYATWRNPFVYFHSLIDGPACVKNDVGIEQLATDLADPSKTPSFAYIAPGACDDGSQTPCKPGAPAGLAPAEAFLRKTVGEIEKSAAYRQGGLIAITFDQTPQSGPGADSSGCCVSGPYPNLPAGSSPTETATGTGSSAASPPAAPAGTASPPGGGKVGLLLISKYVKPGSLNALGEYDHFSLLLTIEKLFGCKPLGYAGAKGLLAFDASVFNAKR